MFFELLFPKRCAICGEPLVKGEKDICLNCICLSKYGGGAWGTYYEKILAMEVQNLDIFLNYDFCQHAIADFKYRGDLYKGRILANLWAKHLSAFDWLGSVQLLVPVPLHPMRIRRRGFNQSEYMARILSKHLGIEVCTSAIVRHRNNPPQVGNKNRYSNVADVFSLKDAKKLENRHILIIDDVITTGATANALLSCLKTVEGLSVSLAFLSHRA